MNDNALELLIYSLDNELSPQEKKQLDQYLTDSAALRQEKALLLQIREGLSGLQAEPDNHFADQIVRQLSTSKDPVQHPGLQVLIMNLFPKVAAACVIVLVAAVLTTFFVEGNLSLEAFIGVQDLSPEDALSLMDY